MKKSCSGEELELDAGPSFVNRDRADDDDHPGEPGHPGQRRLQVRASWCHDLDGKNFHAFLRAVEAWLEASSNLSICFCFEEGLTWLCAHIAYLTFVCFQRVDSCPINGRYRPPLSRNIYPRSYFVLKILGFKTIDWLLWKCRRVLTVYFLEAAFLDQNFNKGKHTFHVNVCVWGFKV